jgi:hypothetical protein
MAITVTFDPSTPSTGSGTGALSNISTKITFQTFPFDKLRDRSPFKHFKHFKLYKPTQLDT